VFPVRHELDFYISLRRNSIFKELNPLKVAATSKAREQDRGFDSGIFLLLCVSKGFAMGQFITYTQLAAFLVSQLISNQKRPEDVIRDRRRLLGYKRFGLCELSCAVNSSRKNK
jgi:hypothetical protein